MKHSYSKTQLDKALVAERKAMRERQKQSAFMRKTLNIYNGMKKRAEEVGKPMPLMLEEIRGWAKQIIGLKCVYCEDNTITVRNFVFDHDTPVCRGGEFTTANMRICCQQCNWRKGSLTYHEFEALQNTLRCMSPEARTDVYRRLTIGGKWSFGK